MGGNSTRPPVHQTSGEGTGKRIMKVGPGRWTIIHEPRPEAATQLLCFHHAGGGANFFRDWPANLGPHVEVVAVQLPGRENRFSEPALADAGAVIENLCGHLAGVLRPGYAVFGHSLGAILGYLFARQTERCGELPRPSRLFVSAALPPLTRRNAAAVEPATADMGFDDLVAQLSRYGATPAALLDNPAHLKLFVHILRNDLRVFASTPRQGSEPIGAPITVIYGTEDDACHSADMAAWAQLSVRDTDLYALPGGHFYFLSARRRFFDILSRHLSSPQVYQPTD
jgi:surfactin synthase thioesterase subunit